jgi:hypothetical protein
MEHGWCCHRQALRPLCEEPRSRPGHPPPWQGKARQHHHGESDTPVHYTYRQLDDHHLHRHCSQSRTIRRHRPLHLPFRQTNACGDPHNLSRLAFAFPLAPCLALPCLALTTLHSHKVVPRPLLLLPSALVRHAPRPNTLRPSPCTLLDPRDPCTEPSASTTNVWCARTPLNPPTFG